MSLRTVTANEGLKQYVINAYRSVNTLNPLKVTSADWISVAGSAARINLKLPAGNEPHAPTPNFLNFLHSHPRYTLPGVYIRGFLYYHVPYPSQFLSGGLRFRCVNNNIPARFPGGYDLENRLGLPWTIPLARMLGKSARFALFVRQLEIDGFLTKVQLKQAARLLQYNPERDLVNQRPGTAPAFVHAVGQPFAIDLSVPVRVAVTGPHRVLKTTVYPAVTSRGGAIVRFERVDEDPEREELCLRVVTPLPDYHDRLRPYYGDQRPLLHPMCEDYLPEFRHLAPLSAGDVLPDPYSKDSAPWVWKTAPPANDAALHCLLHPPEHFPPLPFSVAASPLDPTLPAIPVVPPTSLPPAPSTPPLAFGIKSSSKKSPAPAVPPSPMGTGWGLPAELVPPSPETLFPAAERERQGKERRNERAHQEAGKGWRGGAIRTRGDGSRGGSSSGSSMGLLGFGVGRQRWS
ncbi:hypothetical protein MVEN_00196200 [Mycena venus]|uniref:Uncharacterized protein n=1 Tax=Mycena venus TaxID=2733690 RepID=A0A8H6YX59_9AGAR|nr:hypothetical protein MVEN_00196200 [Mycena venus]